MIAAATSDGSIGPSSVRRRLGRQRSGGGRDRRVRPPAHPDEQRIDQRVERDFGIGVMADAYFAVERQDRVAHVDLAVGYREIRVGQNDTEQEQAIAVLDQGGDLWVAGSTEIAAADQIGMRGQQAAPHEARHHRQVEPPREPRDLVFYAVAAGLHVHHQHRAGGGAQAGDDLVGAFAECVRIGRPRQQGLHRLDLCADKVARQLDVDGKRRFAGAAQHARDLGGRACGIIEDRLIAGDLAKDA